MKAPHHSGSQISLTPVSTLLSFFLLFLLTLNILPPCLLLLIYIYIYIFNPPSLSFLSSYLICYLRAFSLSRTPTLTYITCPPPPLPLPPLPPPISPPLNPPTPLPSTNLLLSLQGCWWKCTNSLNLFTAALYFFLKRYVHVQFVFVFSDLILHNSTSFLLPCLYVPDTGACRALLDRWRQSGSEYQAVR